MEKERNRNLMLHEFKCGHSVEQPQKTYVELSFWDKDGWKSLIITVNI
jgi:hypothetical protein